MVLEWWNALGVVKSGGSSSNFSAIRAWCKDGESMSAAPLMKVEMWSDSGFRPDCRNRCQSCSSRAVWTSCQLMLQPSVFRNYNWIWPPSGIGWLWIVVGAIWRINWILTFTPDIRGTGIIVGAPPSLWHLVWCFIALWLALKRELMEVENQTVCNLVLCYFDFRSCDFLRCSARVNNFLGVLQIT